jgi:signal transduction histidine kinase
MTTRGGPANQETGSEALETALRRLSDRDVRLSNSLVRREFWGLPLFLILFAVTFTLFVFLVSIFQSLGADILPFAGVFVLLSAVFWLIDPFLKERLPVLAANLVLLMIYLLAAQIVLMASGGIASPFFLVYYFVVFTGAMAYGLTGSLMVTFLVAAAYATFIDEITQLPVYLVNIIVLWIIALMIGFLAEMKRRVERREMLQNLRLSALSEVGRFMREMARPEDVMDAGLEALGRLLDAPIVACSVGGRIQAVYPRDHHERFGKGTVDDRSVGERYPLAHNEDSQDAGEIVIVRPAADLTADETRIVRLFLTKLQLIRMTLEGRAELDAIRDEKERILDSIDTGVLTLTPDGRIKTANRCAGEMLELAPEEMVDRASDARPPGLPPAAEFDATPREITLETYRGRPLAVEARVIPDPGADKRAAGWIVILSDLEEVRRLRALIRRSESLAAVGEMAARMAHEVRNPLGGILGFLGLAEKKSSGDVAGYIREAKAGVARLEKTVSDLLDFSRPIESVVGSFELGEAWENLARLEAARATMEERSAALVIEAVVPATAALKLAGDMVLFERVMGNLTRNAREAAGPDGRIEIRARPGDPNCWIEIDDDGPGVPASIADRIFEPFVSTKEQGSGLGLAIVRRTIEALGGTVRYLRGRTADDRPFTRFRIGWPRRETNDPMIRG